eukprot:Gb_15191 [translate_table: standard]
MEESEENSVEESRCWAEMLPEALVVVFRKLSLQDMFMTVPLVCSSWHKASLDPLCWERIDLRDWASDFANSPEDVERMVKLIVDRSCGRLREFSLCDYGTDTMLHYIAERCNFLKCLRFSHSNHITDSAFCKVAYKFPELEELDISGCDNLSKVALQEIGQCCKVLKWLERSGSDCCFTLVANVQNNEEALTIARSMPHLKHLEMTDTQISNEGLLALLEGCSDLEYLDVRRCRNLTIEKTTAEKRFKVKYFHISEDWDDDSQYSDDFEEVDSLLEYDDVIEWINPYDPDYINFHLTEWLMDGG